MLPVAPFPADPSFTDAFFNAWAQRHASGMRHALERGIDVNAVRQVTNEMGETEWMSPLATTGLLSDEAALPLVQALLDAGADVYDQARQQRGGITALGLAVADGHWATALLLLGRMAPNAPHAVLNIGGAAPSAPSHGLLDRALIAGQARMVHTLLNRGVRFQHLGPEGTALHRLAAAMDHVPSSTFPPDVLDLLLDALVRRDPPPDLNAISLVPQHRGATPLDMAVATGREAMVHALLDAGANVNAPVWRYLGAPYTSGGPDENVWVDRGWSALHTAASGNHAHLCRLLLAHGADPERRSERAELVEAVARTTRPGQAYPAFVPGTLGRTPMDVAQYLGQHAAVQAIEEHLLRAHAAQAGAAPETVYRARSRL